jgi:hypothetical protein
MGRPDRLPATARLRLLDTVSLGMVRLRLLDTVSLDMDKLRLRDMDRGRIMLRHRHLRVTRCREGQSLFRREL